MRLQHTFPLSCNGQHPVDDDVDLRRAVTHCYAHFLQAGLQWSLASWEASGHWEKQITQWSPGSTSLSFSILHTQGCHSYDLPEATGRLESAALSAPTASVTRDGYTHTAAVVTPDIRDQSKEEETW